MKKFNDNFKIFSKEEASKIKGGHKKKGKGKKGKRGKEAALESSMCPPPEPDFEL